MPIPGKHKATGEIGKVIAHYDADESQGRFGGATREGFVPDIDRVEEVNEQRASAERRETFTKTALFVLGGAALAATAVYAVKALQTYLENAEESSSEA